MKVVADPSVALVAVERRDRLMRFGAEYVESALAAQGRRLVVVDPDETKDDLVQDMIEVSPETRNACGGEGSGWEHCPAKPAPAKQESPSPKLAAQAVGYKRR
jgi:hypothetical protein